MKLRARVILAFETRYGVAPETRVSRLPAAMAVRGSVMYLLHDVCHDTFEEIAGLFPGETAGNVRFRVTQIEMERSKGLEVKPSTEVMLQAYYALIEKPLRSRSKTAHRSPDGQWTLAEDGE